MNEAVEEPVSGEKPAKKKRKLGFTHKNALLEILARKQIRDRVDYKAISLRTGISAGSLRQLWCDYSNDRIDLGAPVTQQEKEIDDRVQSERILDCVRRVKAMVLNSLEQIVADAEDAMSHGNRLAWKEMEIPAVMKDLKQISDVQVFHEKSFMNVLAEENERRLREQKRELGAAAVPDMEGAMIRLTDEERALKRLKVLEGVPTEPVLEPVA